jgi:hypothetical protein
MKPVLYCGIDLHSNNHYVLIIDQDDKRLKEKRLSNDSSKTLSLPESYQNDLQGCWKNDWINCMHARLVVLDKIGRLS